LGLEAQDEQVETCAGVVAPDILTRQHAAMEAQHIVHEPSVELFQGNHLKLRACLVVDEYTGGCGRSGAVTAERNSEIGAKYGATIDELGQAAGDLLRESVRREDGPQDVEGARKRGLSQRLVSMQVRERRHQYLFSPIVCRRILFYASHRL
jgi:hypothetical protein